MNSTLAAHLVDVVAAEDARDRKDRLANMEAKLREDALRVVARQINAPFSPDLGLEIESAHLTYRGQNTRGCAVVRMSGGRKSVRVHMNLYFPAPDMITRGPAGPVRLSFAHALDFTFDIPAGLHGKRLLKRLTA